VKKTLGALTFFLIYPILWLVTRLPMPILYLFSDFLCFLAYHIIRYRVKVTRKNLLAAFPEKTEQERLAIEKKFYSHLIDSFLESFAMFGFSKNTINKHLRFKNIELVNQYFEQNRNLMVVLGHYGNWDWPANVTQFTPYKILAIYKPLSNKWFDKLFYDIRSKFGVIPVPMNDTLRLVQQYNASKTPFVLYMLADQRPLRQHAKTWLHFMNQETPVLPGTTKISRKYNMPVIFFQTQKIKRGLYEISFNVISENPAQETENECLVKYFKLLEEQIRIAPEYYLWSHNRWRFNSSEVAQQTTITFIDKQ
jgi:Kdo2-lipid IVA lauroyltransferase/acyltransferase